MAGFLRRTIGLRPFSAKLANPTWNLRRGVKIGLYAKGPEATAEVFKRESASMLCLRLFGRLPAAAIAFAIGGLAAASGSHAEIRGECTAAPDAAPRIALISAYNDENERIIDELRRDDGANRYAGCTVINGYRFAIGRLRGADVVTVLSNVSTVNATMVTQLTLDRFEISHIVFSGIAGGVGGLGASDGDPATANEAPLGAVVIPRRWGFHQESYFNQSPRTVPCAAIIPLGLNHVLQSAEAEAESCRYALGEGGAPGAANEAALFAPDDAFAFLRNTNVSSSKRPQHYLDADGVQKLRRFPFPGTAPDPAQDMHMQFWFPVDETLFELAQDLDVTLLDCLPGPEGSCEDEPLKPAPRIIVGENGVSGPAFVDNARYRKYLARTLNFDESGNRRADTDVLVVDMETTAAAMVAASNGVPFIAVRAVSDLAGGGEETAAGELHTFFAIAAENQARTVTELVRQIHLSQSRPGSEN